MEEQIVEVVHGEVVARAERVDLRWSHGCESARVLVELDEIADAETTAILDVVLKFAGESIFVVVIVVNVSRQIVLGEDAFVVERLNDGVAFIDEADFVFRI